ncbi:FAD/NAD(P)-binding protein [Streptomyces sp. NPDC054849]
MSWNLSSRHIAVVGAGAAGTLTAVQLMRQAERLGRALEIWLIDPAGQAGPGAAYGTSDPRHLLNVAAGRMSAFPDDPEHFLRWLAGEGLSCGPGDFVSRQEYGRYLTGVLEDTTARCGRARVHRVRDRVVGARRQGSGLALRLADGSELRTAAAVLALGNFAPGQDWAGARLQRSDRYVADPWAPGALDAVPEDGDLLLIGTGLTMADLAITLARPGRVVHAVSRHGLLPQEHLVDPAPAAAPPSFDGSDGLDALRRDVRRYLAANRRARGDWRPGMDGLRPVTAALWQQLSAVDRTRFLREDLRTWEVHRHRMAPGTAARIFELRAAGRLRTGAAQLVRATPCDDAVSVRLSDGSELHVSAVVNCTGAQSDLGRTADPLVRCLLERGYARTGPAGLGFDTGSDGRVVPAAATSAAPPLWTIGVLRRGNLLESTALPEIRSQAAEVASSILTTLAERRPSRPSDRYGLSLSTTREAAELYDQALERILAGGLGAESLLTEAVGADPDFAAGHAALALLGHECEAPVDTASALAEARRAASHRADDRERNLVAAVAARLTGSRERGKAALLGHIAQHPRDALVVSVAVPTISFNGVTSAEEARPLIEGLSGTYGTDWWYLGQLAFVRQEQERWEEAEALAARALAAHPSAGHAVHALTHVFYETGEHRAGLAWLDGWIRRHGAGSAHRSHFSWHAALHELMLDDRPALHRRYQRELVASRVSGGRVLADSASLLWRARMTGSWSGELPLSALLPAAPEPWLAAPPTAFTALHSALALAGSADLDGLGRLKAHCLTRAPADFLPIAPLCDALSAVVRRHWREAALRLRPLLPVIARVGGSKAQHEVLEETLLYALISGGEHDRAAELLSARLDRRPSPLDRRRLGTVAGPREPLEPVSATGVAHAR